MALALGSSQLDATVEGGITGTYSYSPAAGTTLGAGNSQPLLVTFTPGDTADYTTATQTVYVDVNKATPVIDWAAPAAITSGTALGGTQLDATVEGGVAGSFSYSPVAGTTLGVGTHQMLQATFTPNDTTDYTPATQTVYIDVNQSNQTITFNPPSTEPFTAGTFTLSAISNSGLTIFTYSSSTPDVCTVSGNTVTLLAVGACRLTAHQAGGTFGGATYSAADSSVQTVQVTSAQTITFNPPSTEPFTAGTFTLSASSSVGLTPFTYSSSTQSVCTVGGNTVTLVAAGACLLTAHQAGGTIGGVTYTAADSSVQTVQVTSAQTITFNPPSTEPFTAGTFTLSASSSVGLTSFTYSSSTQSVCTASGNTVTLVAAGACKLTAHQAGGTVGGVTYTAADSSEQTVQVTSTQTITLQPARRRGAQCRRSGLEQQHAFEFRDDQFYLQQQPAERVHDQR